MSAPPGFGLLFTLEEIQEELVANLVVELDSSGLDEGAKFAGATAGRGPPQFTKTALRVAAENGRNPLRRQEVVDGFLNLVAQAALAFPPVCGLGDGSLHTSFLQVL